MGGQLPACWVLTPLPCLLQEPRHPVSPEFGLSAFKGRDGQGCNGLSPTAQERPRGRGRRAKSCKEPHPAL